MNTYCYPLVLHKLRGGMEPQYKRHNGILSCQRIDLNFVEQNDT